MTLSNEVINRFKNVDPATVGHYIGGGFMKPEMKPLKRDETRMVGPAYTVRISGRDSCAIYYAISKAPRGSVIVVDRCGDNTFACCGEMVATYAQGCGMAGIVVDGPITDSIALSKLDIPVFSTGVSAVTTIIIGVTGEVNIPITCSGAIVNPGDIIFGDAETSVKNEVYQREIFAKGQLPNWDIDRLFETDTLAMLAKLRNKD